MKSLPAVIITWNEKDLMRSCIHAPRHIADEVIALNSYFFDNTVIIPLQKAAIVNQQKFPGHKVKKNTSLLSPHHELRCKLMPGEILATGFKSFVFLKMNCLMVYAFPAEN